MKCISKAMSTQKTEIDIRKCTQGALNAIYNPLIIVFTFLWMNSTVAQNVLTPELVAKIENVLQVVSSNDGEYLAYTLSVPADPFKENKAAVSHLYVYQKSIGSSRPFFTRGSVSQVAFRPEHESLTFIYSKSDSPKRVIYEMPLNGGEAEVLYEFDRSITSYAWHPNGSRLIFTATDEAEKSTSRMPYTAKVFEENQPLTSGYIADLQIDNEPEKINVEGSFIQFEWSPDGSKIAVSVTPTSGIDDYYMFQSIKIVDASSRRVIAEISNEGKLGQIVWSPDGSQIAIRAAADINDPTDGRILIASANGGKPKLIDKKFEGKYEHIHWTRSDQIRFLASQSTSSLIGTINPNNGRRQILFQGDDFGVMSIAFADNNQTAFTASSPSHPYELFELTSNGTANRLTHHNTWLDDITLGKQEVVRYKTRDGKFEIDGILIHPTSGSAAAPTITVVHGGPESHYLNGWLTSYSSPGQMAAGQGYAVFYPNYRGSTGRGIDFVYSSQGDLAGSEFDDVVDGVDYLIREGIADGDRIGVTGGSYGGYATAWMSTYYSDRFAAGVMFVGISNNLSKWGTSDIPEELYLVHARSRIWEDWEGYLKRSPIYYVEKSQTPLLIMHGEQDTRVHPGQSLELYRHLKVRKPEVPVRLVWYPGEGHGNRNSTARYDYSVRMMQWFDTYLKTGNAKAEMPSWEAPVKED